MKTTKLKRKSFVNELPDNHTSGKGIRVTRLKSLEKAKSFAPKEKNAKETRATPTWQITPVPVDFHKRATHILVELASSVLIQKFHLNSQKILSYYFFYRQTGILFVGDLKLNINISCIKYNLKFTSNIWHQIINRYMSTNLP